MTKWAKDGIVSAGEAASYILSTCGPEDGVTGAKLPLVLYYAQTVALCSADIDRPLFDDPILAWADGPRLVGQPWAGDVPLSKPAGFDPDSLPAKARLAIDRAMSHYGILSTAEMRRQITFEYGWRTGMKWPPVREGRAIPHSVIAERHGFARSE